MKEVVIILFGILGFFLKKLVLRKSEMYSEFLGPILGFVVGIEAGYIIVRIIQETKFISC